MHPLETEVDRLITDLQGDLEKSKETFDSGTIYRFNFDDIPVYVALPVHVPTRTDCLARVECELGLVDAKEVGRVLFAISLDLDMNRHHAIRVVPRTKDGRSYALLLQLVCSVDLMQAGFIATTVLYAAELAGFYRQDFLHQSKAA